VAEVWPNVNVGGALTSFIAWGDKGVRDHYSPELTAVNSNNGSWHLFLPPARCASTFLAQWSLQARSLPTFKGWPGLVPNCARRTTTASSWGFR